MLKIHPSIVIGTDQAGQIRFFNETAQKITGYTAEEVRGIDAIALLAPPDYQAAARAFMQACQRSNPAGMIKYPLVTKSGARRLVSWQCCAMDSETGCTGVLWLGVSVEEQVRLEELLHHKGTIVHKVLESVAFPLFVLDRQYCYMAYNAAHREMMKILFDADVEPGSHFLSYFRDPDKRAITKGQLDQALAGEAVTFEGIIADEQNQTNNILVVNNPMRDADGEIIGVAVAAHDISSLRHAEAEVVRMQSCYKALVEEIPAVMMVIGSAGRIEYINSYGARLFRFSPAELAGRSLEETILPEVESTGRNLWLMYRQIWSVPIHNQKFTHENLTRNGRRVWIEWSIQPGGSPMTGRAGWLCMGVDVTEKHRSLEMERRRTERNRQNGIMQEILSGRLSEKNAAEQLFALGLDLRNHLLCLAIWRTPVSPPEEYAAYRQEIDLLLDRCRSDSGGIVWEMADCIGILVSYNTEMLSQMKKPEQQAAEELWRKLRHVRFLGVKAAGAAFGSPGEARIDRLFLQARSALLFGPCLHPKQHLFYWKDLGWLRLLAQNVDSPEARNFVAEHLSGVIRLPDTEKREELLSTLRMTLDCIPVEEIAMKMNVHRQTVRYRMSVLTRLLEVDGFMGETRINVALALRLHDIQKMRNEAL